MRGPVFFEESAASPGSVSKIEVSSQHRVPDNQVAPNAGPETPATTPAPEQTVLHFPAGGRSTQGTGHLRQPGSTREARSPPSPLGTPRGNLLRCGSSKSTCRAYPGRCAQWGHCLLNAASPAAATRLE